MDNGNVAGLQPWLPWPLSRSPWWTETIRAERLAALRIGLAAVLLLDILGTYLPRASEFFGHDSLGSYEVFAGSAASPTSHWSLLNGIQEPGVLRIMFLVWAGLAFLLLVGMWARMAAALTWMLSVSLIHLNPGIHNTGDGVRTIVLFYLMLCPCNAAWSLDALCDRKRRALQGPVYVAAWPVRLLFVQLALIYFCNGLYKLTGPNWPAGNSLYYVLHDLSITRWSYVQAPIPYWWTQALTWLVLGWELGFPFLVLVRSTRVAALLVGVALHVGIGVSLEVGLFSLYMLCLYLPLLPWGDWGERRRRQAVMQARWAAMT